MSEYDSWQARELLLQLPVPKTIKHVPSPVPRPTRFSEESHIKDFSNPQAAKTASSAIKDRRVG